MNFENSLKENKAKKVIPNKIRAASLIKSSKQAIETAKIIKEISPKIKVFIGGIHPSVNYEDFLRHRRFAATISLFFSASIHYTMPCQAGDTVF